ncbi:MAG: hypothetical protein HYS87_01465 [Candidatus Colwellbacteria bacterium]|nr:hypothetical protein [Candidatus Colwellbacteria bacterium]
MLNLIKSVYHRFLSFIGPILYGFPSRKLFVIGVTGTKGKTTTIELINAGLEAAGHKTAISSSYRRKIGDKSDYKGGNTMPGRFFLQKFLRNAAKEGCKYAIIEVTSEGVAQYRHRGIDFDAAVFLNLHPEHIESHGSFEKYRAAKVRFFEDVRKYSHKDNKNFFINREDANSKYFEEAAKGENIILYGKSDLKKQMAGEFNKLNIGAAEAVLKAVGVSRETIEKTFLAFNGVPGRMEYVQREPFAVVVDYAHTPDSLEAVYKTLTSGVMIDHNTENKRDLVCVLGSAGGGRDKWKRPKMGEIAAKYCREIILTNEDPYDEDPNQILSEIKSGISNFKFQISNLYEILDRKEAIKKAISLAKLGDAVVITGKGSEPYIHVKGGKTLPWSDKKAVEKALSS